nr:hypothetical protein [Cupriavidus taiwanensis]
MTPTLLVAILSSSVISAALTALIGGWYAIRTKRHEYVNDYYKKIISRRIEAYEKLESLIDQTKTSVLDTDNKLYHRLFAYDFKSDPSNHPAVQVARAIGNGQWFGERVFNLTQSFSYAVFGTPQDQAGMIQFGKDNYKKIAVLREQLEAEIARDLLHLHDVPRFLKARAKRIRAGFQHVSSEGSAGLSVTKKKA